MDLICDEIGISFFNDGFPEEGRTFIALEKKFFEVFDGEEREFDGDWYVGKVRDGEAMLGCYNGSASFDRQIFERRILKWGYIDGEKCGNE